MHDWLIVGGGPQGCFIAAGLRAAAPNAAVAVMDPEPPLTAWGRRAEACGMAFLRSSNAHHLGQRADALRVFARAHGYDDTHALGYYRRPSRALFEAHARQAFTDLPRLARRAARIEPVAGGGAWSVVDAAGRRHRSRRVVLATGPGQPYRPPGLHRAEHVYDPDFAVADGGAARRTAVVGGGITGAQLALRTAAAGMPTVWVTRQPPRTADFDSDPCYAGPRCLRPFTQTPIARRGTALAAARRPGTLPPDVHARMRAALAAGELDWRHGSAAGIDAHGLVLADGRRLAAERVILATGFEAVPAAGSVLGRVVAELGLAIDGAGHIHVGPDLAAAPGLYLAGRPASLQLGPTAGNIQGARLAGRVLTAIARAPAAA